MVWLSHGILLVEWSICLHYISRMNLVADALVRHDVQAVEVCCWDFALGFCIGLLPFDYGFEKI